MVGLDDAHHAALAIDHGQGVQVVLVEELGEFVLVQVDGAGEDAGFSEHGEARLGLGHDQASKRNGATQHAPLVEQVDLGDTLRVAFKVAQGLDGLGHGRVAAQGNEVGGHAARGGVLVKFKKILDLLTFFRFHLFEDGVGLVFRQFGQQVGGCTWIHLLDNVGDPLFFQVLEQGLLKFGLDLFKGFGGHFHNDDSVAALRDIPGIVVASPSRGDDAAAMLRTCVAAARSEGSVCLFLEPIALYRTADLHAPGDGRAALLRR